MGVYLNSKKPHSIYEKVVHSVYFVDKTKMLEELIVNPGNPYICVTRPRRFGKTVVAAMIAAFFGKGRKEDMIFDSLEIASSKEYQKHHNKHNVIYISFNKIPNQCTTYKQYIERIQEKLFEDLEHEFPMMKLNKKDAIWDSLDTIYESSEDDEKFIFVLDEWDYIFHQDFATEADKQSYIRFLSNLLKDQPYVELAYMTGILPIAKYSSGSELNMFWEYTMATEEKYSNYFGFSEAEVDKLFHKYLSVTPTPHITREELKIWYNGYHTKIGERVYNPRSIVISLSNNNLGNYWTSSGPYDEIFFYIKNNIADVREDLVLMMSGIPVPAKVREYAAVSMNLQTKDEIFSAMVVYGFLSYQDGYVSIPNKELMDKFNDMLLKESSLGYVYQLAKESERMLRATLVGDTDTMVEILEFAHNTEIPLLNYSNETDLTALVNLVYLSARDSYRVEREDKAGIGYVDFIFYPELDYKADCIILELKINHTAREAIQQIKDKKYLLKFKPKLGEKEKYTGRILAVGITYDKETKKHSCEVEVVREKK
jgi:hypothetical protein